MDALASALAVRTAATMNALGQASGYYTAVAKLACCSMAEKAVREGRRVLGARALLDDLPYARLVRDVLQYGVFDGTSHVMLGHVRDYLRQMATRGGEGNPEGALAQTRAIFEAPPRSLLAMDHRRRRAELPSPGCRLRGLNRLPGTTDLGPLAEIGDAVLELAGELGPGGLWAGDQGSGYALADAAGRLEGVVALAELGDQERRDALGVPPMTGPLRVGPELLRYALARGGLDCAARLRRLAGRGGLETRTNVERAEEVLMDEFESARGSLHRRLTESPGPGHVSHG
jgi:hypothetical protein